MEFWSNLFDTSGFPRRWDCGNWSDIHGWLHIVSDLGIWAAYFTIPLVLLYFISERKDLPFRRVFFLFGAFILCCGTTHLMEAIIFWYPHYRLAGLIKLVTAVVSWVTIFALVKMLPHALAMRSPEELQREIDARIAAEKALQEVNNELENRVAARTAELKSANDLLSTEREWFQTTLTSMGDGVITCDNDGNVTLLNTTAERLTGWTTEEATGQPITQIFPIVSESTRTEVENPAICALETGEIVLLAKDTMLVDKRGQEIPVDDSAAPILNAAGESTGVVLIFRDVSERRNMEQAQTDQTVLLQTVTDNATTAIFMTDENGYCNFMNPAAQDLMGFVIDDLDGIPLHKVIHHSHPDGSPLDVEDCPIVQTLTSGSEIHDYETHFVRKDGVFFPASCNAQPIMRSGNASGIVLEITDLTERKQSQLELEDSEARFSQLADHISQLAWMTREDGWIFWYNRRWYEFTGTTLEEMQGWGWKSVHHPDHVSRVEQKFRDHLQAGQPWEDTFPLRGADGEFRWFLSRAMPIRDADGNIVRWFGTNTDIEEAKRLQEELRETAARLSEADRRKDEFLATLAHELRNPLAPIRTGLEVLKLAPENEELQASVRETLERQTQQLITLVDDLLDVSRITRGKLHLRKSKVILQDIVDSAIEATRPVIDQARHELIVEVPPEPVELEADPHRLAQVFSNLLNNAAKYTPTEGKIVFTAEQHADTVVVTVEDNGIGIPQEMQENIFRMFAQIERSGSDGESGLGIGLTLVRSLLDLHKGSIEVSSDGPNRGSVFRVELPLMVEDPPPPSAATSNTTGNPTVNSKLNILVVDDNQAAAEMLQMMVRMLGHQVNLAFDGQQAIDAAEKHRPDIILMDIGMPVMTGNEAARHIRKQSWGHDMLLIALTGWGQEEDRRRTRESGFDKHLVKPADPRELQDIFTRRQQHSGDNRSS